MLPKGELHLNANAAGGEITVSLCDADGRPIPGFEASQPIAGDALDVPIRWAKPVAPATHSKEVRLRVSMRNADLYAYWWE